jgi:acetyl-CoA synthetase
VRDTRRRPTASDKLPDIGAKTRLGNSCAALRAKIVEEGFSDLGATSTLADSTIIDDLDANRMNRK